MFCSVCDETPAVLQTQQLDTYFGGLTPENLVDVLVGISSNAPTISNVTYTGMDGAAGIFTGGLAAGLGFESGIILSTGSIHLVRDRGGQNTVDDRTFAWNVQGDADLDALLDDETLATTDAAVLEFTFECEFLQVITFRYRFASEEYNEYVNTDFNDIFAFFVNGENIALLPESMTPVAINNVNCGNPDPVFGDPTPNNCEYFVNNSCIAPPDSDDPSPEFPCIPPAIISEMDGFTVTLTATAFLQPGPNDIKIAIADTSPIVQIGIDPFGQPIYGPNDFILDSVVFIEAGSFSCEPPATFEGACCLPDGSCQNLTFDACELAGGVFSLEPCNEVECVQPPQLGACCGNDGSCGYVTKDECNGVFHEGLSCDEVDCPQPPVIGACCFFDGECFQMTAEECLEEEGEFHPETDCPDVVCELPPPLIRACCLGNGTCLDVTKEDCESYNGTFYADALCADDYVECEQPPPPTGACCFGNGDCEVVSQAECTGDYQGDGTACGACDVIVFDCVYSQGYWKNHPNAWPVNNLTLGTSNYNSTELMGILNTPVKGNGLVSLSHQLIAARLNQENGAYTPPAVQSAIDAAQSLIDDQVIPPWGTGYLHPSATGGLSTILDMYNNGLLGTPKCD